MALGQRFNDDNDGGASFSGGSTTFTNNNGVFQSTSQSVGPDGRVRTTHTRGHGGKLDSRISDDEPQNINPNVYHYNPYAFPQVCIRLKIF